MNLETLLFEVKGKVGIITLNRPEQRNALNGQMLVELNEVLDKCEIEKDISVLVLTGGTKVFCAGADIKYAASLQAEGKFVLFSKQTRDIFHKIETHSKPVIAAISGFVLGGGLELALCCDLRVASENAKIGMPEVKLGAIPGAGGTQRLSRLVGPALAKELIFTGKHISADEAYRINLVNTIAPAEEYLNKAVMLANDISENAPLALQAAKTSINTGLQVDLESGLNVETLCATALESTEDQKEGFLAFQEKRKPVWKGQ